MSLDYLKRYEAGEHNAWDELVGLAPDVLSKPEFHAQAIAVAEALMARVRSNVDILRNTLIAAGASVGERGTRLTANDLEFLTDRFGPLPLILDVFYQTIGSIILTPKDDYDYGGVTLEDVDGVSLIALDPLEIEPASEFKWLLDEYEETPDDGPFELYLCPDFLHKQNISGGMPYSVQLPSATPQDALDPKVLWERHELSFVNYLRHCFKWGGFPGLDVCEVDDDKDIDRNWRIGFEHVRGPWRSAFRRLLLELRKDLLEF